MRIIYKLKILSKENLKWLGQIAPTKIDNFVVTWEVPEEEKIKSILIILENICVSADETGKINTEFEHLKESVYKTANFLVNKIYITTGIDIANPANIFFNPPELVAETEEEAEILKTTPRQLKSSCPILYKSYRHLDIQNLHFGSDSSQAYSFFADGQRASSPFLKYEQFYKVIEYFFSGKGKQFDKNVSDYTSKIKPEYNSEKIEYLRQLRNRCIHPKANLGHTNPESLSDTQEVRSALPEMTELAQLLLNEPPMKT